MTGRIVWTEISVDLHRGRVGGIPLFAVEREIGDHPWKLTSRLPVTFAYVGGRTADDAKGAAEKVLAAFVKRIGAQFLVSRATLADRGDPGAACKPGDEPPAVPGCAEWRRSNGRADLCANPACARCRYIRQL